MKVRELIEKLKDCNKDREIRIEVTKDGEKDYAAIDSVENNSPSFACPIYLQCVLD